MNELIAAFISQLGEIVTAITSLKGPPAVIVDLIFIGYIAKMITVVKNKYIPVINFTLGPMLALIMVGWPDPSDIDAGVKWPGLAAWSTSITQGLLFACAAWILHAKVLRKLVDDKIPALNLGRVTDKVVHSETVTGAGSQQSVKSESVTTTEMNPHEKTIPPAPAAPAP